MPYKLELTQRAQTDLQAHARSGDVKLLKKVRTLLDELREHPETGTGQPERLKYDLSGFWSRRINHKHRMIYSIDDGTVTVTVTSARGHYSDK